MKHRIVGLIFLSCSLLFSEDFVVPKKKKKELAVSVKQDIAEQLELSLRKLGENIQQAVTVQGKILDTMHELLQDDTTKFQVSTAQLKKYRERLEQFNQQLQQECQHMKKFSCCFQA